LGARVRTAQHHGPTWWKRAILLSLSTTVMCALAACAASDPNQVGLSLILKTQTNPYFVSMKQSADEQAHEAKVHLSVAAGTADGDTQTQINAIDTAIARGDKGILITSNGDAVNAALRQAKDNGLFVIALDTPLNPVNTADITFATDNEEAGRLIGRYTGARLKGGKAVVAMLDLYDDQVVSVDIERDHGFLEGMGIDPGSKGLNAKEAKQGHYTAGKGGQYVIACHQATQGAVDGGRTAMEQCLSKNPNINVVYTINEPAGRGAYAAMRAAKKTGQAFIVTIDGSCEGMGNVKSGMFAADATQYPGKMAGLGVSSIAKLARGGAPPKASSGKNFLDTGTNLVTGHPVPGIKSQTPTQGLKACWGQAGD
jgi:fructose transport system substrate-binding protein